MDFSSDEQSLVLEAARETIRAALGGPTASSPPIDWTAPALCSPAGCFVTLHTLEARTLRGCVGRLDAEGPLAATLREASRSVLADPRFVTDPVSLAELPGLELEVSVLSPTRPAAGPLDFDPLRDGILLSVGNRQGCFLPQVAHETGWGREKLLSRLCTEKLGLPPDAWRGGDARLLLFSAVMIGPEPFEPRGAGGSRIEG